MLKKSPLAIIFALISFSLPISGAQKFIEDGSALYATLDGKRFELEVANTDKSRVRGLSGREKMPYDGMIFFFQQPQKLIFWMKDMNFPIDIIWIKDGKVSGFAQNAAPEPGKADYLLRKYFSPGAADTVIELNAGDIKKYNIKEGTILKYPEAGK
jgi:uncharacterized membrane protein (UPF0127 family)